MARTSSIVAGTMPACLAVALVGLRIDGNRVYVFRVQPG
jgi:hypothetical protein